MILACLQIYQELLSLVTFLRVHSNSKEVSYLSWQNTHPNLKTTCHIKLKFFLWTKLLENLLHAKYLISVAASLILEVIRNEIHQRSLSFLAFHIILVDRLDVFLALPIRITTQIPFVRKMIMNWTQVSKITNTKIKFVSREVAFMEKDL